MNRMSWRCSRSVRPNNFRIIRVLEPAVGILVQAASDDLAEAPRTFRRHAPGSWLLARRHQVYCAHVVSAFFGLLGTAGDQPDVWTVTADGVCSANRLPGPLARLLLWATSISTQIVPQGYIDSRYIDSECE